MSSPGANGKMGVPRTGDTHSEGAQTFRALGRAPLQKTDLSDFYYGKETRWQELSWPLENEQYAQAVCRNAAGHAVWDASSGSRHPQPEQGGARLCSAEPSLGAPTAAAAPPQWNVFCALLGLSEGRAQRGAG